MNKFLLILCGLLLFLFIPQAFAFDQTYVVTKDEFEDLIIKSGSVTINNFSIDEKSAWSGKGLTNIAISFSAKNKAESSKHFSVMLAGVGEKAILWAVGVEPSFSIISGKKTEALSESLYITPGTIQKTKKIWVKVVGDF